MPTPDGIWRVFVASPSDVQEERDSVCGIAERLTNHLRRFPGWKDLEVQVKRAEVDVPPGGHPNGAQALIENTVQIAEFDFVLAIFWKRFGTPVGDHGSGTEREVSIAYAASEKQSRPPRIMIYFKTDKYAIETEDDAKQVLAVMRFKKQWLPKLIVKEYLDLRQFDQFVYDDLFFLITDSLVVAKTAQTGNYQAQMSAGGNN